MSGRLVSSHVCPSLLACFVLICSASNLFGQEGKPDGPVPLAKVVSFDFENKSLNSVLTAMADEMEIEVQIDVAALEEIGVGVDEESDVAAIVEGLRSRHGLRIKRDTAVWKALQDLVAKPVRPITFHISGVTFHSALGHLLRQIDPQLTFSFENGVLVVSTRDEADANMLTRVYDVRDLIDTQPVERASDRFDPAASTGAAVDSYWDYDALVELITKTVDPVSWDEVGGAGSIHGEYGAITVAQRYDNHEKVAALLTALRTAIARKTAKNGDDRLTPIPASQWPAAAANERRILEALDQTIELNYAGATLNEVAQDLADRLKVEVRIDWQCLNDVGISAEPSNPDPNPDPFGDTAHQGVAARSPQVTFASRSLPLRRALQLMLGQVDITFMVLDEALVITTHECDEQALRRVVYPVQDLVAFGSSDPAHPSRPDYDGLIESVTRTVAPDSWDEVGGPGSIAEFELGDAIIVAQTSENHRRIEQLLAQTREVAARLKRAAPQDEERDDYAIVVFRLWQPWHEQAQIPEEDIVKLLQDLIEPESWEAKEVFVRPLPSRLVIRQKKSVQRQVYNLLLDLGVLKPEEPEPRPPVVGFGGGGFGGTGGGGGLFGGAGALPPAGQ